MSATDAHPVPLKGLPYRITFPIVDATGEPVPGATGLDSEVSLDGAAFVDCVNEAVEIAPASGVYFLDLISPEFTADTVVARIRSTEGKTVVRVMHPSGDIGTAEYYLKCVAEEICQSCECVPTANCF